MLNLCMNCTDALRKKETALLRVCGRFDGAVCVRGFQGTDTFPGQESETHQRQRHSAPQSSLCLLSTEEEKNRSRFTPDRRKRLWKYLVLPGDGNAACVEFGVEIFVRLVQSDSPQCGKLIDVQHVAAIHVSGLHK